MAQAAKIITIIGGSGFLGRYAVQKLAEAGYSIKILCRHVEAAKDLKILGALGQIAVEQADMNHSESFKEKLRGSYAVVNTTGILYQRGRQKFLNLHANAPEKLAQLAQAEGVERFVHISALGVDRAKGSDYAQSKLLGEKAVLAAFPAASILRPSVVFGAEDNFFNQFARMATLAPALPLIGGGHTKFQPVYVEDVAKTIEAVLAQDDTKGKIFELAGPDVMSFRDILEFILKTTGRKACLVNLPFGIASMIGSVSEFKLNPFAPMITRDQVRLLKTDNVAQGSLPGLQALGIAPKSVAEIVPHYLSRFRRGGAVQ